MPQERIAWPLTELDQAYMALQAYAKLPRTVAAPAVMPDRGMAARVVQLAQHHQFDGEIVRLDQAQLHQLRHTTGWSMIVAADQQVLFLIVGRRGRWLRLLTPQQHIIHLSLDQLLSEVLTGVSDDQAHLQPLIKALGQQVDRAALRTTMIHELGIPQQALLLFRLRLPISSPLWHQCRAEGLPSALVSFLAGFVGYMAGFIGSWWWLGRSFLERPAQTTLIVWLLWLVAAFAGRVVMLRAQGRLAAAAGVILRRQLMARALRLNPDQTRRYGVGQLLGKVLDSESFETLLIMGGLFSLTGLLEVVIALLLLWFGAGSISLTLVLFGWLSLLGVFGWWLMQQQRQWTLDRLAVTHTQIELMLGHRTRLIQEPHHEQHHYQQQLERYHTATTQLHRWTVLFGSLAGRGWLLLALLFWYWQANSGSPVALMIALGAILSAYQALQSVALGSQQLVAAAVAWEQLETLIQPASVSPPLHTQWLPQPPTESHPLVELAQVTYTYPSRSVQVFEPLNLSIAAGDRILVSGPSGGGKSTLAALLAGQRQPTHGTIRWHGHRLPPMAAPPVAMALQFHQNHLLSGPLIWNLLLGREWPPQPTDIEAAEALCHELGLTDLLARMPAGIFQYVGDTGWQLSHGERSRVFLARALLQRSELIILDESLAALDPPTLQLVVETIMRRASTLMVIAHP